MDFNPKVPKQLLPIVKKLAREFEKEILRGHPTRKEKPIGILNSFKQ